MPSALHHSAFGGTSLAPQVQHHCAFGTTSLRLWRNITCTAGATSLCLRHYITPPLAEHHLHRRCNISSALPKHHSPAVTASPSGITKTTKTPLRPSTKVFASSGFILNIAVESASDNAEDALFTETER